ncbi:MAG: biotin/lipoyl-containing protein [Anaerolineae bacterium]
MTSTSSRRVTVIVNGKPYQIEVGDLTTSPITVTVNGRPYAVRIETDGLVAVPAQAEIAPEVPAPPKTPHPSGLAGQPMSQIKAPMPGNILDIAVKPGDQVHFRQQLCSLEAMKMKSAIRSPRDGIIASVEVAEGQAVAHDDVLFTFRSSAEPFDQAQDRRTETFE